ncbi:glycosyltransferase [Gelidibacter salicanalis]|uniref:Glycosyltransferase n=1 Tax=Gelidibacter salicanalis TaxID=291193 RepID=A0A5C7ATV4_9FLAO|nr:glycosyltransferase [Gelidibacter salicanalis]TXE09272.1 glycosyltransferase [Gelidibacter salicanalis]
MSIYYYVPDNIKPSWGIGVIYHHVKALNESGQSAFVLHQKQGFILPWLELKVPTKYRDAISNYEISSSDSLVVPEVMAHESFVLQCKARKILFIQATGWIFEALPLHVTHKKLGFSSAMVIMPHMLPIVEKFIGLPSFLVPPMVADYFFNKPIPLHRKKTIVMYPKFNQIDFSIVNGLLRRKLGNNKIKKALGVDWRIQLLEGLSHQEVSATFDQATFFISLNTFEALNTSVVEAMARGCIVFCYEGFGPKDFLLDNINAFVFGNNEPYALVEKIYDILDQPDQYKSQLGTMRQHALETANQYTYDKMKESLANQIEFIVNE